MNYWKPRLLIDKFKKNGICKAYYPKGKLSLEGNLSNSQKEGLFKSYYPSGKISGEMNYVNNR